MQYRWERVKENVGGRMGKSGCKQMFQGDAPLGKVQNQGNIWKKIEVKKECPGKTKAVKCLC